MFASNRKDFIACFDELDDHRKNEKVLYPLNEILFLVIVSVLTFAENWKSIVQYGEHKLDLLRQYFPYEHGIASKSTLCSVIGMINKKKFESWFIKWVDGLVDILPEELIAIDGKTLCGSKTDTKKAAHILNAFATKHGLVIAQRTVDSKTNEITEIPALLDDLNIEGGVVSTDSMGCQKKIAEKIIEKKADYFLALKGNQGDLFEDVKSIFETNISEIPFFETIDKGHGRVEVRRSYSLPVPKLLNISHDKWQELNSLCMIESERHLKNN